MIPRNPLNSSLLTFYWWDYDVNKSSFVRLFVFVILIKIDVVNKKYIIGTSVSQIKKSFKWSSGITLQVVIKI